MDAQKPGFCQSNLLLALFMTILTTPAWWVKLLKVQKVAGLPLYSYKSTSGDGSVWGDGIVPISAAHLAGARNLMLPDVFHSPSPGRLWYGSKWVVEDWSQWLE